MFYEEPKHQDEEHCGHLKTQKCGLECVVLMQDFKINARKFAKLECNISQHAAQLERRKSHHYTGKNSYKLSLWGRKWQSNQMLLS